MYSFVFILDVNFLRESDGEVVSLVLFLEYGPSLILIAYLSSFIFKSSSRGQTVIFLVVYLGSFLLSVTSFVLRLVESTREAHDDIVSWIFRLFPFYNFTVSFIHMGNVGLYKIFYKWEEIPDYFDAKITLYEIIFLAATIFLMILILLLIENWIKFVAFIRKNKDTSDSDYKRAPYEIREMVKKDLEEKNTQREFNSNQVFILK
jgi:hypothetical protein